MSFTPRPYEKIVEDMLTTLTGGTVRETIELVNEADALILGKLRNRPVARVSHLEVFYNDEQGDTQSYRYAAGDFELVNGEGGKSDPDRLRISEGARPAQVGDSFVVNYYPSQTPPVPLTDIQPGSVTRTLVETFAREMAVAHLQMDHVYQSAFLETATGKSLDRVVALLGLTRFPGGFPLVKLSFSRKANTPGQITIPAGTAVTDSQGTRYQTLTTLSLEPYETSRDVLAAAEAKTSPVVDANQLNFPETVIAGIDRVTNPEPAYQITQPESDADLRTRARQALLAGVGGTMEALVGGVRAIEGVKSVTYTEHPNGLPGEIRLDIVYGDDSEDVKAAVTQRINHLRPAGIRVLINDDTQERVIALMVDLTFAGDGPATAAREKLLGQLKTKLQAHFENLAPKSKLRQAQLANLLLADPQIIDGKVSVMDQDGQLLEQPSLNADEVFKVQTIEFGTIETENGTLTSATALTVGAHLVVLLEQGFPAAEVQAGLDKAFGNYLQSASTQGSLSIQAVLQALRDDQRYVLVADQLILSLETQDGQFIQLAEGLGEHPLPPGQKLQKGALSFDFPGEDA